MSANEKEEYYQNNPWVCPRCKKRFNKQNKLDNHFNENPKCSLRAITLMLPWKFGWDYKFHPQYRELMELSKDNRCKV